MTSDKDAETDDVDLEFGSKVCICPRCGVELSHRYRGRPCSEQKCPKCGATMRGEQCSG